MTLVCNLEVYGIDPTEFAHIVQKAVACSTNVLVGGKNGAEVMVQGNQINYIVRLLTGTGLIQYMRMQKSLVFRKSSAISLSQATK